MVDLGGAINSAHLKAVLPMSLPRLQAASHTPSRIDDHELASALSLTSLTGEERESHWEAKRTDVEPTAEGPSELPSEGVALSTISLDDILIEDAGERRKAAGEAREEEAGSCARGSSPPFLLGGNVRLRSHAHSIQVSRSQGYHHGLVVGRQPLAKLQLFQVRVDRISGQWRDSLSLGFIMSAQHPDDLFPASRPLPDSAFNLLTGKSALSSPENLSTLSYCQVRSLLVR